MADESELDALRKLSPQTQTNELLLRLLTESRKTNVLLTRMTQLARRQTRMQDLAIAVGDGRFPFGDGIGETLRHDLNSTTGPRLLYKNALNRPVRIRLRVLVEGDGTLDIMPRASSTAVARLDLTVLHDETPELVLLPNAEVWGQPQFEGGGAAVGVEVRDYLAWADPKLVSQRPGGDL